MVADPQDGDSRPITGHLTFWDNIVDQTTDSIKLKATFENKDHRLWPGQFARVTLQLSMMNGATVVPQEAIQAGQDGSFVFVVNNQRAEQRPVKTGARVGDDIVVQEGLAPGETVVTEGQLRLEQGTQVQLADANGNPQGGRGGTGGRTGGRGARGRRNGGDASGGGGGSSSAGNPDGAGGGNAGNPNGAGGRASS